MFRGMDFALNVIIMKSIDTIFTIGHSNTSVEDFILKLKSFQIEHIADIRHFPGSRKYPWFNKENLSEKLKDEGIDYTHVLLLGGRRPPEKNSHNTSWTHPAFRGFADYMEKDDFKKGMEILLSIAEKERTAIMCSEVLWWRCHRSMISDYLLNKGIKVMHIMGVNNSKEHRYTAQAKIINGKLSYREERLF